MHESIRPVKAGVSPAPRALADRNDTLLTEKDFARLRCCSVSTIRNERIRGTGAPYIKMARSVRYVRADVETWLLARRRSGTGAGGLPLLLMDRFFDELATAVQGRPSFDRLHSALERALRPHAAALALTLAPGERQADGTLVLRVPRHMDYAPDFAERLHFVVTLDPSTLEWRSPTGSSMIAPGVLGLVTHLLNIQGAQIGQIEAATRLLGCLGAAALLNSKNACA